MLCIIFGHVFVSRRWSIWGAPVPVPGATRSTRTSRRSSPSRRPCGALLNFGEFLSYFVLSFRCVRHFVINVINNNRIHFIMSFSWYVLWYTVHSVVYTCDLILARIWLVGLCSFINRVLQSGIRAVSTIGRKPRYDWSSFKSSSLSNPCLLKLFYYYTPWLLWLLPFLPWFLSLKNSFCRFGLNQSSDHHEYQLGEPL